MLSSWTREALEHKGNIAADTSSDEDNPLPWRADRERAAADCEAAIAGGTMAEHCLAAEELCDYLGGDTIPAEWRAINVDLARGGHLVRHDPKTVRLGRGPKNIKVDGVQYEAW